MPPLKQCELRPRIAGGFVSRRIEPEKLVLVELDVPVFKTTRRMLNREDHYLVSLLIYYRVTR
jgi:hypothetical protein